MEQYGGKLIGYGSKTCIFKPNIPCSNKKKSTISNDMISKIYLSKKVKIKHEMKITNLLKGLDGIDEWSVLLDKDCKPPDYNSIYNYDKDILSCLNKFDVSISEYNKYKQMMYGPYGGISMDSFFLKLMKKKDILMPNEIHLSNICDAVSKLFYGLFVMNSNSILQFDIKPGNILYKDNFLRYIDFGITNKFSDPYIHKRSLIEFNNTRIYIFYPYEFIYMNAPKNELLDELEHYSSRNNYNMYEFIHKHIFKRNIKNHMKLIINLSIKKKINKNEIIKKLDTYSLGISIIKQIMASILSHKLTMKHIINYFNNPINKTFVNILKDMTEPLYINRPTVEIIYERFTKL
jgi:hypothetical protein